MHKAPHTVSPIRQSLWGSACLSACVSPLSVIITSQLQEGEKKNVCALMHGWWWCLRALARTHQSVFSVYVAPLLPTDGHLRHNAGGLSFEASTPTPPTPLHLVLPLCLPHPSLLFPSPLWAHRAERKASILHRQAPEPGCRQWKPFSVTVKRQI